MSGHEAHSARIVAGTLTLLSREIHQVGRPVTLWSPEIEPEFIRETAAKVAAGKALPLWVEERHPARGLAVYIGSPWESEILGLPCGRLAGPFMVVEDQIDRENRVRKLARLAIEQGKLAGHKMIISKTIHDPAVLRGFLAEGFVLAEIGASLKGDVPEESGRPLESLPQGFCFLSGEELKEVAEEAVETLGDFFYDGHFRHDPVPGPEAAARLWSRVALDDLNGLAEPALLLWDRSRNRAGGLATVRRDGYRARLSILAVSPHYQGRGFGRRLMAEVLSRLEGRAREIDVETSSYNLPALSLYLSLGLVHTTPLAALHCHL